MTEHPQTSTHVALPADVLTILADPQRAATLLDAIGRECGDKRYRQAAGFLRGHYGGRPPCDDADAIRQMTDLLASDDALSIHSAAAFVARAMPGNHSAGATAWRLARKFRATMKKQTGID